MSKKSDEVLLKELDKKTQECDDKKNMLRQEFVDLIFERYVINKVKKNSQFSKNYECTKFIKNEHYFEIRMFYKKHFINFTVNKGQFEICVDRVDIFKHQHLFDIYELRDYITVCSNTLDLDANSDSDADSDSDEDFDPDNVTTNERNILANFLCVLARMFEL